MTQGQAKIIELIKTGNVPELTLQIEETPSLNFLDGLGESPLHWALQRNNLPIISVVLECEKANLDFKNKRKETALYQFCLNQAYESNLEGIKLLLKYGANPNIKKTSKSFTALHYAMVVRNEELANLLLSHGANSNEGKNREQWTPLFYAWNKTITNSLLEAGAEVDILDNKGVSPLYYALLLEGEEDSNGEVFKRLYAISNLKNKKEIYLEHSKKLFKHKIHDYLKKTSGI